MKGYITGIVLLMGLSLSGCDSLGGPKQGAGTLIGGAGGALLGSQFGKGGGQVAGAAIGTMVGALVGAEVGKSMDDADRERSNRAFNRAASAPVGTRINWNNEQNGNSGTWKATKDGTSSDGRYCREFVHKVQIGGKTEEAVGTACRNPDGSWRMQ